MFNNINMKFFNGHFLILIAIIIVIYFLYKEINFLHKKINKLQESIENKINKTSHEQPNKELNFLQTSESSESSDHIAIYSNDNENSSSLLFENNEQSDKVIINIKLDEEKSQDQFLNIPSNIDVSENHIDETILLSEINSPNVQDSNLTIIQDIDDKIIESMNTDTLQTMTDIMNQEQQTENKIENQEINLINLEKMKLSDVKKIAEQHNITLSKKINGIQKQKNKKELIDNILNKI